MYIVIVINMSFFIRVEDQVNMERITQISSMGMRFTVCISLPMEVITVTKPVDTIAISSLTDIPSEVQAISSLY